jgi:hypothetical protein
MAPGLAANTGFGRTKDLFHGKEKVYGSIP